jgi:hypothetical protein
MSDSGDKSKRLKDLVIVGLVGGAIGALIGWLVVVIFGTGMIVGESGAIGVTIRGAIIGAIVGVGAIVGAIVGAVKWLK